MHIWILNSNFLQLFEANIASVSFKYHGLPTCHFGIELISLQKEGFLISASVLNRSLRLVRSYCDWIVNNYLKFTWELAYLPKSTKFQLNQSVDFISGHSFFTCTNAESYWNSYFIAHWTINLSNTAFFGEFLSIVNFD